MLGDAGIVVQGHIGLATARDQARVVRSDEFAQLGGKRHYAIMVEAMLFVLTKANMAAD